MISQSVDSETVMTSGILILQPVCWSRMFAGCIAGCICVVHYCLKATCRSGVAGTVQQRYIFVILIRHSNNASCNAAFCRPRPETESKPPKLSDSIARITSMPVHAYPNSWQEK
jgi:hypothetical protein